MVRKYRTLKINPDGNDKEILFEEEILNALSTNTFNYIIPTKFYNKFLITIENSDEIDVSFKVGNSTTSCTWVYPNKLNRVSSDWFDSGLGDTISSASNIAFTINSPFKYLEVDITNIANDNTDIKIIIRGIHYGER